MPVDSFSAGSVLLSWGATYFIHSTCLIAGVWLFIRNRPSAGHALRETLWKTALVGGVVTATVQMWLSPASPFGNLTLRFDGIAPFDAAAVDPAVNDALSTNPFSLDAPVSQDNRPEPSRQVQYAHDRLLEEMAANPAERDLGNEALDSNAQIAASSVRPSATLFADTQTPAARRGHSAYPNLNRAGQIGFGRVVRAHPATVFGLLVFATLAVVLGLARCSWQTILLRRKLAGCRLIESGAARELLDELLRTVSGTPSVLLLKAPDDIEPAVFGIARWTIVLPPRAASDLSEAELRALLAHELAHLVRGDSLWLCICRTLCSCLAFQPLNHLARREWQRTAEFLCDNWAINRTGAPLALARCLAEVASWRLAGRNSNAILAATGRQSGLVDRIERLLDARPVDESQGDLRHRRFTVFAGVVVLTLLAWGAPRVQLVAGSGGSGVVKGNAKLTDAAKPPASGERQSRPDVLEVVPLQPESANSAQQVDTESASLLNALDDDLMALERELEQLGPLLHANAAPPAVALASRLRNEIVQLQQRREALQALWQKPVN